MKCLLLLLVLLVFAGCEGNPAAVEDMVPPTYADIELPGECYTPVGTHYPYDRVDSGTICYYGYPATVRAVVRRKFYGKTCQESYWISQEIRPIYGCAWALNVLKEKV